MAALRTTGEAASSVLLLSPGPSRPAVVSAFPPGTPSHGSAGPSSARPPVPSAGASSAFAPQRKIGPDDFVFGSLLGEGAYARVLHCRLKQPPTGLQQQQQLQAPPTPLLLPAAAPTGEGASSATAAGAATPTHSSANLSSATSTSSGASATPTLSGAGHSASLSTTAAASTASFAAAGGPRTPRPLDFAVKIMEKRHIKKENKTHFVMMERSVLSRAAHPCIVRLCYTFQDAEYLYIVMDLCRGGELLRMIRHFNALNTMSEAGAEESRRVVDVQQQQAVAVPAMLAVVAGGGISTANAGVVSAAVNVGGGSSHSGRQLISLAGSPVTDTAIVSSSSSYAASNTNSGGGSATSSSGAPRLQLGNGAPRSSAGPTSTTLGVPLPVVQFYMAQLVTALEYLHTVLHVVHRDIKPENILLTDRCVAGYICTSSYTGTRTLYHQYLYIYAWRTQGLHQGD